MKYSIEQVNEQKRNIEKDLEYIKENLQNINGPIFIELLGTAKSGKTTLLNSVTTMFEKKGILVQKRKETAEYNPIQNKELEEYNIWMYSELMKNVSEDMSDLTPRIVIYDRGMLDRIPWIDFSVNDGSIPKKDGELLKQFLKSEFMKRYKPICYGFVTSPELSVARKGKEGRLVNRRNVELFNKYMQQEKETIKNGARKYSEIITDPYQGYLQKFIMDVANDMTKNIKEEIKERQKEEKEK